jgi:hypothetical protein
MLSQKTAEKGLTRTLAHGASTRFQTDGALSGAHLKIDPQ